MLDDMFPAIDAMDVDRDAGFLATDCTLRVPFATVAPPAFASARLKHSAQRVSLPGVPA